MTVGDLLAAPFERHFKSPHEAKLFADKLKTTILPELRKLIESYKARQEAETVEF